MAVSYGHGEFRWLEVHTYGREALGKHQAANIIHISAPLYLSTGVDLFEYCVGASVQPRGGWMGGNVHQVGVWVRA